MTFAFPQLCSILVFRFIQLIMLQRNHRALNPWKRLSDWRKCWHWRLLPEMLNKPLLFRKLYYITDCTLVKLSMCRVQPTTLAIQSECRIQHRRGWNFFFLVVIHLGQNLRHAFVPSMLWVMVWHSGASFVACHHENTPPQGKNCAKSCSYVFISLWSLSALRKSDCHCIAREVMKLNIA